MHRSSKHKQLTKYFSWFQPFSISINNFSTNWEIAWKSGNHCSEWEMLSFKWYDKLWRSFVSARHFYIKFKFLLQFSTSTVLETYTLFVNNVNRAKSAIRGASNHRPAFARFLENMAREHKGKLTLDNLLIKPVQKFPKYVQNLLS